VREAAETARGRLVERSLGKLLDRAVVRRLVAPAGVAVVAVGGSTFGGSGKTPLAIACAAELARAGARVVLVGHAYRADPRWPRFVLPDDRLGDVGDEALLAVRALERPDGRARVVVAPSRAEAIAFAAQAADVLVLDGVAQLAPVRATLALLAVDAADPWGARCALPPRGALRATLAALVAACDAIVPLTDGIAPPADALADLARARDGDADARVHAVASREASARPMWPARVESRGAWVDGGELLTWEVIRSLRVGLLVALGRPERVVRWLDRRGVAPRAIVRARDHGPFRAGARSAALAARGIDVWLATPKCALHAASGLPGLPLAVLDHSVVLDERLRDRLQDQLRNRLRAGAAALTGGGGTNSLELLESTRIVPSKAAASVPSARSLGSDGMMMMRPPA
jgi:tetraacyldisaccharide-1-P 4'-kinase